MKTWIRDRETILYMVAVIVALLCFAGNLGESLQR